MNARCYVAKYLAILVAINGARDVEMGFARWNEVRLMRRILLGVTLAPFAVALIAVAALIVNDQLDKRTGRSFQRIQLGATEMAVVALMGKPDTVRPCGDNLWWGGDADYLGKNDGRCVTEARYEYFLSAWAVGYSADHDVVSKYHYFSE
jgi:hypothetical protein